jgi:hypothetical protein
MGNSKPEGTPGLPPHMLDPNMRHKDFTCKICGEARSYGGWEDAQVDFHNPDETVHLGCLKDYALQLTTQAKLAMENLKSGIQSLENPVCDFTSIAMKSFQDALNNLKTGLPGHD